MERLTYWKSGVVFLTALFVWAFVVGWSFGYWPFKMPHLTGADVGWAAGALAVCFGLRWAARMVRSEEELRKLSVFERAPRNAVEMAWFCAAAVLAGIAEETAYRGVGWQIGWYSLGDPWSSAAILSFAFALAHWNQGWKSGVVILVFAVVFHVLVAMTETLVLAMVVHAVYDLIAGALIQTQAREFDREKEARENGPIV